MLKKPSAPSFPAAAAKEPLAPGSDGDGAMEVESTHVHVLADGKKPVDVTLRRPEVPASKQAALVVPQFDDESDDSSSSDDSNGGATHRAPVYSSSLRKPQQQQRDDDDVEDNNNSNCGDNGRDAQQSNSGISFQGDFEWDNVGMHDIQQLTNANTQLAAQATDFKRQIKSLQIQLEALAPVAGLNPEMVQDILLEREGAEHDIRDAKIVRQAKTLRHLKRTLQREKQIALDAVKQCKLMETAKQQLESLKLKAARFQARAAAAAHTQFQGAAQQEASPREHASQPITSSSPAAASASDTQFRKRFDDLKVKTDKLQSDFKELQRALQREVGDDVPLDDILESADGTSGKRGRAQQIVMLRARVKKLEVELANTNSPSGGLQHSAALSNNVDLRAQQELAGQHAQKQKLVDKSKNDDALQGQLETWKTKVQEVKRVRTAESVSGNSTIAAQQKDELERLRSMVAEYKRQQGSVSSQSMALASGMPVPSEASQYRTMAAEKERLHDVVKGLQSQLEEKERQLCLVKQQQPPMMPSMLPALTENTWDASSWARSQQESGGDAMHGAEVEALRRTFRESLRAKEDQVAALTTRLHDLETQQQQQRNRHQDSQLDGGDEGLAQEVQDLQEENQFLRQEFEKLKTRYEALVRNAKPSANGSSSKAK